MKGRWLTGVVADAAGYASERAGRLLLTAVVGIFVARYLGPDGYGLLNYASGVFLLLGSLTLLGMPQILLRDFSTNEDWRPLLTSALASQVPAAITASVVAFLIIVVTRGSDRQALLLALVMLPLPLLDLSSSVRSYLEATSRMRRIVVTGLFAAVAASILKVAGLLLHAPVWVFGAFGTVHSAIVFAGLFGGLPGRKRVEGLRRFFKRDIAERLLRESWPLLLAAVAVNVYMKADILMLGMISGDHETGLYAAAARLSEVWYFIPVSAAAAIRPKLARMFADGDLAHYRASTQQFMSSAVGVSLVVLALVVATADWIIGFLYGSEFLGASPVLRIHILSAPFVFLGVAGSQWFIDRNMTKAVLVRSGIGAVLNVVINLALMPRYGAMGASIATLIAYASGVLINVFPKETRPLFRMQMRAFRLRWPQTGRTDT